MLPAHPRAQLYWLSPESPLPLRLCFLLSSVLGCLAALSLAAQSPAPTASNPAPLIRTNAQAVSVDVVVTRGSDEPVLALHQRDFQVFEDGKPQAIDLFEEHTAPASTPAVTPLQLPPHVYTNQPAVPQIDAVNVLLLDSLNTPESDQAFVHKQIVNFLQSIQPGTRIAIFTLNTRLHLLQGFTSDGSLLRAALNSKGAAPATTPASRTRDDDLRDKEEVAILGEMGYIQGAADSDLGPQGNARSLAEMSATQAGQRASLTLAALQQLARAMAAIPVRKNLIWFASSFPVSIFPNGPNRQTLANGKEIGEAVRQTASLLTQAKVALYPVSAQGILVDHTMNADSSGQPNGDDFEKAPNKEAPAIAANRAAMEQLATDTGGEALYSTNNLNQAIDRAVRNGSHYYTLVYTPPSALMDGKFHRIEVKLVERKDRLSYRRGYFADTLPAASPDSKPAPAADPLAPMLARGLPASTQILFQTRVVPATPQPASDSPRAGGNTKLTGSLTRYKVDVVINPTTIALDSAADGTRNGKIEVALVAYDEAGKQVNWTGQTLALALPPASYAQVLRVGIPVHLQIDLPQADLSLSTGVFDLTAHKAGTLEIALQPQSAASQN
jgi:VWFA-related protein